MVLFLFGSSSTIFWTVSSICCQYYYYGWIHITDFFLLLIIGFCALIFLHHNNTKQHSMVIILNIGCEFLIQVWFEFQADCWERYWFTIVIQPVIKPLIFIWCNTHLVFELWLVLKLWHLQKIDWIPLIKKCLCFCYPCWFYH